MNSLGFRIHHAINTSKSSRGGAHATETTICQSLGINSDRLNQYYNNIKTPKLMEIVTISQITKYPISLLITGHEDEFDKILSKTIGDNDIENNAKALTLYMKNYWQYFFRDEEFKRFIIEKVEEFNKNKVI